MINYSPQAMDVVQPQSHHNLYLPPEVIGLVIDCFIPPSGLHISNDPNLQACLNTISSLSRTSCMVRSQVHKAFNRPLNITITNSRECRKRPACSQTLDPRLAKALALPLQMFPEIKITFAPQVQIKPCRRSYEDIRRRGRPVVDEQLLKFRANTICMIRQSNALAFALQNHHALRAGAHLKFLWDGSRGVDQANRNRPFPLWEFHYIEPLMGNWYWVKTRWPGTTYEICFPKKVSTRYISDNDWVELRESPRYMSSFFESLPVPSNPTELVERTWQFFWVDFWAGPWGPVWYFEGSDDQKSASRFIVTLKKITNGREVRYVYTAAKVVAK
ncbi:hypothetical protein H2200_011698 [Cladophialophora chaetospira]|uniref:Uncharacterized protein n=1 Tax=Cladophialophora chaetospira TaxID=386627 RepID=A0AA38WYM5_9EURO|nr:hypothetical protein H2200_011698 [Cladophialophora chaetospira]